MIESERESLRRNRDACTDAVLVTRGGEIGIHGRPMAIAAMDADGTLWFLTSRSSPKVSEIRQHSEVEVVCRKKDSTLVLDGRAEVHDDRAQISKLWSNDLVTWFPHGKDDPDLCLISVRLAHGEYWDKDGTKGVKYGLDDCRAYIEGRRPEAKRS